MGKKSQHQTSLVYITQPVHNVTEAGAKRQSSKDKIMMK